MIKAFRTKKRDTASPGAGFTLVELITAAAIFSVLGVMLFSMIRSSMTMWKDGEVSRNEMERGVMALETIARELRLAFTENDPIGGQAAARFLCDFIDYDRDGDGNLEARVQRLLFTRINAEERENELYRTAGDEALGRLYFTLFQEDPEVVKEEGTRPTGGLAEAVFMSYAPRLSKGQKRDGLLSLYRGFRTPIGGEDSFFAPGNLIRPGEIEAQLLPVLNGLLYLEFRFWNQNTQTFDAQMIRPEEFEGAGYTWDSTRAILPGDRAAGLNYFPFGRDEASLEDVSDDLFPSRVLVTVVVEEPTDREALPRMMADIKKDAMEITVDVPRYFQRVEEKDRFVRIDEEWMRYARVEDGRLVVAQRGVRNTIPQPHRRGSLVHRGRTFTTVVEIATGRACWNEYE